MHTTPSQPTGTFLDHRGFLLAAGLVYLLQAAWLVWIDFGSGSERWANYRWLAIIACAVLFVAGNASVLLFLRRKAPAEQAR